MGPINIVVILCGDDLQNVRKPPYEIRRDLSGSHAIDIGTPLTCEIRANCDVKTHQEPEGMNRLATKNVQCDHPCVVGVRSDAASFVLVSIMIAATGSAPTRRDQQQPGHGCTQPSYLRYRWRGNLVWKMIAELPKFLLRPSHFSKIHNSCNLFN